VFTPTLDGPILRIGIYRTSSLGDMVLATACLNALAQLPIRATIYWIGRSPVLELIKESYPNVQTLEVSDSTGGSELDRMVESLKPLHFLIDLQRSVRSRLFCQRLAKHGVRIYGMNKLQIERNRLIVAARVRGRSRPLPQASVEVYKFQYEMMLDALYCGLRDFLPVEILDSFKGSRPIPKLHLSQEKAAEKPWFREMGFGKWMALAPGASHETKRAQAELFKNILEKVTQENPDVNLVILGNEDDRRFSLNVLDHLKWHGSILNLAGKLSLMDSAHALQQCETLLSNDSSLAHIAEALGVPVSVLFGPTIERFGFAPRRSDSRSFSSLIGCRPCSKHGKQPCRYQDQMCFLNIQPSTVATRINEVLKKSKHSDQPKLDPTKFNTGDSHPIHQQY